jgi:parallel beta helix pectate lyase-like protein
MEIRTRKSLLLAASFTLLLLLSAVACGPAPEGTAERAPRTITVAQSGAADVVGTDNVALQKAADLLQPGDTLAIGEGTYTMDNGVYLPSDVTVRGVAGKTILLKNAGVESMLEDDGDFGETEIFVTEPAKFRPGMGITVFDDVLKSGWDISTTTVTAVDGNRLEIFPRTERDYELANNNARVKNTFPILCAVDAENVVIEDMIVDGNRAENAYIDGCRGGAIYLYRVRNITVRNCVARNYNGDGISFQITEGVKVLNCESHGHSGYGVHPGTGSADALVKNNHLHDNDDIGLFLCWRVKNGEFSDNVMENNGNYGISIGHKDTDNLFVNNKITRNGHSGVFFRRETFKNSGHRNTFRDNIIEDNGNPKTGYGFYIQPLAGDIVIENNRIAETRKEEGTQRYGVYKVTGAGKVTLNNNRMEGNLEREYAEGPGDSE